MPKNAIVYLLNNNPKDVGNFRESINRLYHHFLKRFKEDCDVILFHEPDFPDSEKYTIGFALSNFFNLSFEEIQFQIPQQYNEETLSRIPEYFPHPDFPNVPGFSLGYRGMCDFFSGGIFNHPLIKQYKYVWRLDTDSFLLDTIKQSPFETMRKEKKVYGFINVQNDHPKTCEGAWEEAENFFRINPDAVKTDIFKTPENNKGRVFYTNFEILDVEWFNSEKGGYMSYYNHIKNSAGIYTKRWGDHVIRYLGVKTLTLPDQIKFFNEIDYFHSERYLNRFFHNTFS